MRAVLRGKLWARDEAQRWGVLEEAVGRRTGEGAPEQRPAEFRPLEVRGAQEKAEVGEAKGNGSQMRGDRPRLPVPRDQPSTDKRLVFHSWDVPDDRRGFGDEAGAEG